MLMQYLPYHAGVLLLKLGNITILSLIVILKSHDNLYGRKIFSIALSSIRYYHKYRDYHKIHCSETYTSVKCFHLIFIILVAVVLLSDIMIISIIAIITLMIYLDMTFLLSPIPTYYALFYDCYVFLVFDVAILS